MSPKRSAHLENLPVVHSSVLEPAESRWRRLCPGWAASEATDETLGTSASERSSWTGHRAGTSSGDHSTASNRARRAGPYTDAAVRVVARSDAPVVRHVRHGATTDALAALRAVGAIALVEALLQDRYARSAATSMTSLWSTWMPAQMSILYPPLLWREAMIKETSTVFSAEGSAVLTAWASCMHETVKSSMHEAFIFGPK